jgi:hypothetical protein
MATQDFDCKYLNLENEFDSLVEKSLGAYIYILTEPKKRNSSYPPKPFYIGKGGGDGKGNDRLVDHFVEARKLLNVETNDAKIKKIHEIWSKGEEVDWYVFRCENPGSDSAAAELIESALIQYSNMFLTDKLANKSKVNSKSFKDRNEVLASCAKRLLFSDLEENYINRPIFLFNIKNSYERTKNLEESLVRSWLINDKNRQLKGALAVGLIDSISHCVLDIKSWNKSGSDNGNRYEIEPGTGRNDTLLYKNFGDILHHVKSFWGFGARGGGIIFKVDREGRLIFLYGLGKGKPNGIKFRES